MSVPVSVSVPVFVSVCLCVCVSVSVCLCVCVLKLELGLRLSLAICYCAAYGFQESETVENIMNFENVTTVPKNGSKLLLRNERGIFRVLVIRSILMRLIYDGKYPEIDRLIFTAPVR